MPWKVFQEDDKYCVYEITEGGDKVKKMECYTTEEEAQQYKEALYANEPTAEVLASLPKMTFWIEKDGEEHLLTGGELDVIQEIVSFKDGILATVERNANGDYISPENALQIAASIPLHPLTTEHNKPDSIVGMFTYGKVWQVDEKQYIGVDGIVWPARSPTVVNEIMNGERKLSIEAVGDAVTCSKCGVTARRRQEYCEHLQPILAGRKLAPDVSRKFNNLRARGGAAVRDPAGTDTGFDRSAFLVIASELEDSISEETMTEEHDKLVQELRARIVELEAALAERETALTEKDEFIASLEANVKAAGEEATQALEAAKAEANTRLERVRRLVESGMDAEEIDRLMPVIASMTEEVFGVLAEKQNQLVAARNKPEPTPATPPALDDPEQETPVRGRFKIGI